MEITGNPTLSSASFVRLSSSRERSRMFLPSTTRSSAALIPISFMGGMASARSGENSSVIAAIGIFGSKLGMVCEARATEGDGSASCAPVYLKYVPPARAREDSHVFRAGRPAKEGRIRSGTVARRQVQGLEKRSRRDHRRRRKESAEYRESWYFDRLRDGNTSERRIPDVSRNARRNTVTGSGGATQSPARVRSRCKGCARAGGPVQHVIGHYNSQAHVRSGLQARHGEQPMPWLRKENSF